jgi:hypothetical protein
MFPSRLPNSPGLTIYIEQALVGTPPEREIRQPDEETSQEFHAKSSTLTLKKRAMMAAVCSQSRISVCSCLRPAAVRL